MKRIITVFAVLFVTVITLSAQTDIKKFNKATPSRILKMMGNPTEKWMDYPEEGQMWLGEDTIDGFGPSGVLMGIGRKSHELIDFSTNSKKYCILSDVVPGGVKVGTKISDLQKYDFSNTRYGRNKPGNAIKATGENNVQNGKEYIIYGEEYQYISLYVKNGIVILWQFITNEQEDYKFFDHSVSFF